MSDMMGRIGSPVPVADGGTGTTTGTSANTGNRMGTIRGLYCAAQVQSGRYLRNGATDLYHFVSMDTSAAGDGLMLTASP